MADHIFEDQEYKFSEEELVEVQGHLGKYPTTKSAVMPVLWMAQNKFGWLSKEAMQLVADTVGLPFAHVYGVASFYTMYFKQPFPKYVFDVCTCFTCGELGGDAVLKAGKEYTQADEKGFSADGLFYFRAAECLGACDTGPVCQVSNKHYAHGLDTGKLHQLIDDLKVGREPGFVSIPMIDQSKV